MGPGPATCTEDEPLGELQQLLSQSHGGRVPVVRDGDVVGVVTRGDLLRALGEGPEEQSDAADTRTSRRPSGS